MYKLLKSSFLLLSITLLASDDPHWRERYAGSEGVEETKGDDSLTIAFEGYEEQVVIPRQISFKFAYLRTLAESQTEMDEENELITLPAKLPFFVPNNLAKLVEIVQGNTHILDEMPSEVLVEIVQLANYLLLDDWSFLQDVVQSRLIDQATPELIQQVGAGPAIYLPNPPKPFSLSNVYKVYWNPSGESYFVGFKDDSGMLYHADGTPVAGSRLENLFGWVYWSPSGASYFVRFRDGSGVLYHADGTAVAGSRLRNVVMGDVYWNPSGAGYFVRFRDHSGMLYRSNGTAIVGSYLTNISDVNWSSLGDYYFVKFKDRPSKLYYADGTEVANFCLSATVSVCWIPLWSKSIVGIDWSPLGDRYFGRFADWSGRLYRINGTEIEGSRLEKVVKIDWSPSGESYFVRFMDGSGMLYRADGTPIESSRLENVNNIDWNSLGGSYFVTFRDGSGMLYHANGMEVVGSRVENIRQFSSINWSPSGESYFIIFRDSSAMRYRTDGTAVKASRVEGVVDIFWDPSGGNYFILFNNNVAVLYSLPYALLSSAYRFTLDQLMLVNYINKKYAANRAPVELADVDLQKQFAGLPAEVSRYFIDRHMVVFPMAEVD